MATHPKGTLKFLRSPLYLFAFFAPSRETNPSRLRVLPTNSHQNTPDTGTHIAMAQAVAGALQRGAALTAMRGYLDSREDAKNAKETFLHRL
jgi:hypothetical protein